MGEITLLSAFVSAVVTVSVLSVLAAIWLDFKKYGGRNNTRQKKRSPVATGTMLLFFCGYYIVLRAQAGVLYPASRTLRLWMIWVGLILVVCGAVVNIWGRRVLKQNWADHIKIYDDHQLVTAGPFRYVRHPLYASLFLMFYGGCFLYANWLGALLTSTVFVPMMNFRAAQEEVLLLQTFPEYAAYKQKAGRFVPLSPTGYKRGNL